MEDSERYKWVVIKEGDVFDGGIFADAKQVGKMVGKSESTIRRKGKENQFFWINNYRILRLPYYKSKRGSNE